jgi:hypothetical protein
MVAAGVAGVDTAFAGAKKRAPKTDATPLPAGPPLEAVDVTKLPDGILRLDLFLLMGQSNMKGRGEIPADQKTNPRIVMMHMTNDQWYVAQHPLHMTGQPDAIDGSSNAGVGPGGAFAETVLDRTPGVMVGLIPCAVGGSKVAQWQKGVNRSLYDEALRRARLALQVTAPVKAQIRAALWLQGESDSKDDLYGRYEENLLKVVDTLRADLALPDLPFIACTIGSFIASKAEAYPRTKEVNEILLALPKKRQHAACVDARDLTGNIGDNLHYNTESQTVIGQRYADTYLQLTAAK